MRTFLCFLIGGCLLAPKIIAGATSLKRLATAMIGSFTTAEQALADRDFRNITLPVSRIWSDRPDGRWLYLEQALTDAPEHPYRQFIYQCTAREDGDIDVHIFNLPDPIAATGAEKNPARLDKLSPAACTLQRECTLIIQAHPDGTFTGKTAGRGGASELRGASYATTELSISTQQIKIWDRGYNAQGTQVWSSINSGYLFKKSE